MSIKKFIASKDTTITDAYKEDYRSRAINSNIGAADSLEVFSIYGQVTTSSLEKSRILVEFPISQILSDRQSGKLPASGSVNYFLKLTNVVHPFSVPRQFKMTINPITKYWEEGYGLDMEGYTDDGFKENIGGNGATWVMASSGTYWDTQGGDYLTSSQYTLTSSFETGLENIELDITEITERWLSSVIPNYGFIIKLSSSYEDGSTLQSFYTKKFSARGSQFFYSRPAIEARWNPAVTDDRNSFYASSSLLSADDNKMNLYFYNKVNGASKNIVNNPTATVKFYSNSSLSNEIIPSYLSVTNPFPGVYKAQVAINTTASILYDKWVDASNITDKFFSSSFDVLQRENDIVSDVPQYIINITNMKSSYFQNENTRFNIFVRERDWQPNIYTVAYNNIENIIIPNLYYKIFRFNDNYTVIDYSTGSLAYTKTSYDSNGNYFDLDMNILEKDYGYAIKLATWDGVQLQEFKDIFKFRVE